MPLSSLSPCCLSFFIFHFSIFAKQTTKTKNPQKRKHPPTPLQWVPLVCWARLAAFPTRCTSKRGHQRKHLDCLHGFDLKGLISFESAFLINYYKSISRFRRKCVFTRAESFPYDFLRIVSLASSGFPSNWGVKNTSEITFFCKNGVVYKMTNNCFRRAPGNKNR